MFCSFRQTNARVILDLSSRTLESHFSLIIYFMAHVHQGHFTYDIGLQTHAEQSRARTSLHDGCQCGSAGVIKAIVSFDLVNLDTAFERHTSRIPINDFNTVHALKCALLNSLV